MDFNHCSYFHQAFTLYFELKVYSAFDSETDIHVFLQIDWMIDCLTFLLRKFHPYGDATADESDPYLHYKHTF